jgi:hypothetical protein
MQSQLCALKFALPLCLLIGSAVAPAVTAKEAAGLERGLAAQAPALIKHCKEKKYRNVGVLKFLILREGKKGFSDNVGTLNMLLARRLEVALVLANDTKNPVGVIRNASAVAARTRGANHRSPAGRRKLFEPDYPLAWGDREVKADAFLTGTAQVSKDLRTMTVSLLAFDKASNKLAQVGDDFKVRSDAGKLAELNESFLLRGHGDEETVIRTAARVVQRQVRHPLQESSLPVRLEVLYDGKVVKIEHRDGKAFVPGPREGQKVAFRLVRDSSKERYGVVLKVNGESTIGRQRLPDLHCRRWILGPGSKPITIWGYQMDDREAEEFKVISPAESKAREMSYGADVGTISLTVFRESQKEETYDPDREREKKRLQAIASARLPANKATYQALKSELLKESNESETRSPESLVVPGQKIKFKVRTVPFTPDPIPVMSVTIIYYNRTR